MKCVNFFAEIKGNQGQSGGRKKRNTIPFVTASCSHKNKYNSNPYVHALTGAGEGSA